MVYLLFAFLFSTIATATPSPQTDWPWPYPSNTLQRNESLLPGQSLSSSTATLHLQSDGDLILRRRYDGAILFHTDTGGKCVSRLLFDLYGSLVLKACDETTPPLWIAQSGSRTNASLAVLEDTCRLVLYEEAPTTAEVWASNGPMCLEVHLVPHSHDDVGWLLTPEQYYTGCDDTSPPQKNRGVRGILTSTVDALLANPERKYVQVEMYFFDQWWREQTEARKKQVRGLIQSGQLEFANAGWAMQDEACVHFQSGIANMALGAAYIKEHLNVTNRIGWHVDPFGHASATPRMMAEMRFDAWFFERQDYQQKLKQVREKTLEQVWRSSDSLGRRVDLFTSPMNLGYGSGCEVVDACPSSFQNYYCQEYSTSDYKTAILAHRRNKPSATGKERRNRMSLQEGDGYNDYLAEAYIEHCRTYAAPYRTNQVLIPYGTDFAHEDAEQDFTFIEKIMKTINANYTKYGARIFFSTPTKYIQAVNAMNYTWPVNEYDYFIDSDHGHAYWSGYLTSRAAYKGYERELSLRYLPAIYQIQSKAKSTARDDGTSADSVRVWTNPTSYSADIRVLREALGVSQHHDSITGTEKVYVRDRYQFLLANGTAAALRAVSKMMEEETGEERIQFCPLANISRCPATQWLGKNQTSLTLYVYNSLPHQKVEVVEIPIPVPNVVVRDGFGNAVQSQVTATWALTRTVDNTSPLEDSLMDYTLYFLINQTGLSYSTYMLELVPISQVTETLAVQAQVTGTNAEVQLENDDYKVTFSAATGGIQSVLNKKTQRVTPMTQNFYHYCPNTGDYVSRQASGAYIFRPCVANEKPIAFSTTFENVYVIRGPLFDEVRQVIHSASNIHQSIRLLKGALGNGAFMVEWGIGEVDVASSGVGKEIVMRIDTGVQSDSTWYTDSQGLEVERRIRDSRPNYAYTPTEPVAGNFFPSYVFSYIRSASDAHDNVAIIGDRSRACASLANGQLELLVHRRLLQDDGRGVGEALNENTRIISRNFFIVQHWPSSFNATLRRTVLEGGARALVMFGGRSGSSTGPRRDAGGMNPPFPPQIHLLSRELVTNKKILVRLQHLYAIEDDAQLSKPASVDMRTLFPHQKVKSIVETDLNGITPLSSAPPRMSWRTSSGMASSRRQHALNAVALREGDTVVTLQAMEIRCFWVLIA